MTASCPFLHKFQLVYKLAEAVSLHISYPFKMKAAYHKPSVFAYMQTFEMMPIILREARTGKIHISLLLLSPATVLLILSVILEFMLMNFDFLF
ncbi:hypothetical protein ACJX0J_021097, partial [Zea mays]